jgi:hypothetical protein
MATSRSRHASAGVLLVRKSSGMVSLERNPLPPCGRIRSQFPMARLCPTTSPSWLRIRRSTEEGTGFLFTRAHSRREAAVTKSHVVAPKERTSIRLLSDIS